MKILLLTYIILASSITQCKSQNKVIGEIQNGRFIVTVNKDSLVKSANNILKEQKLTPNLTKVTIEEGVVDKTTQKCYYVRFTNDNTDIKLVQLLSEKSGKFSILQSTMERGASVSCSGCRKGCDPKPYVDKDNQIEFYCSDCTLGDTRDCKKTSTQGTLDP